MSELHDLTRPRFDVVTAIEQGDLARGYKEIDISGKDERLYSLTCPLMLGQIIAAIQSMRRAGGPALRFKRLCDLSEASGRSNYLSAGLKIFRSRAMEFSPYSLANAYPHYSLLE